MRLDVGQDDEISRLALQFNKIAEGLEAAVRRSKDYNRELEEGIAKKTSETCSR